MPADPPPAREARERLVAELEKRGFVRSKRVADALRTVPREVFLPERGRRHAYDDAPQDIGEGQTMSAPHMVAIMVEALDLRAGMRVLEVGGGSGYHAAVAAELVRPGGHVFSVERVPALARRARSSLRDAGYEDDVTVVTGDGSLGLPEHAPYDRMWVAAAAPRVPQPLLDQLAAGGILLVPVGSRRDQVLARVARNDGIHREDLGGCRFVPLVGAHGF